MAMVHYHLDEKAKLRRQRTDEAIALAMQSKWEEAVNINNSIVEVFPDDVGAYNRLGKALTELGRYADAREAYAKALEIKPQNSIAQKNLERLALLKETATEHKNEGRISPDLFIEETGKTKIARLHNVAPAEVMAKVNAGAPVNLRPTGRTLMVESTAGEYIGEIDPRLGLHLSKLMEGGNKYAAAVSSVAGQEARVIIKETYRHPSRAERPSFTAKVADDFKPYVKDSMMKYGLEEEEEETSNEEGDAGSREKQSPSEEVSLEDMARMDEGEDDLQAVNE